MTLKIRKEEEGRSKPIFFGHLPDVALRRIFAELTIGEKLRTAPVSKAWNSYVTISLRSETELSYRQLYSRAFQDHESRYTLYEGEIKKVVRRMCHPETGLTQLRTVDLKGIVFDSRSSCREDVTFLTAVCPNLKQFYGEVSESKDLRLFARDCPELTHYACRPIGSPRGTLNYEDIGLLLLSKCSKMTHLDVCLWDWINGFVFDQAKCSLQSLSFDMWAYTCGDLISIVHKFPDLKHLKYGGSLTWVDLLPLKDLPLEELDLSDCPANPKGKAPLFLSGDEATKSPLASSLAIRC